MTEDEAKQKWCPMVRLHLNGMGNVYSNKPPTGDNPTCAADEHTAKCIASDCMMWRWSHIESAINVDAKNRGYCGLLAK